MKYKILGNYFNGAFHLPSENDITQVISKYSPADLEDHLWDCPLTYQQLDPLIESAEKGFHIWRKVSLNDRSNFLKKFQGEVKKIKNELATVISLEMGKPLWESLSEVDSVISKVDVTLNYATKRIEPTFVEQIMDNTNGEVHFKPLGVTLTIGPFNFPCHLPNTQILSALLAGNSVIFKPSDKTCYSGQLLMECFHRAELPPGVINLYQGGGEITTRLVKRKEIKGIYFTGSQEVGLKILGHTHQDLNKLVALEMGGKNTTIINRDAPFDLALMETLKSCFLTSGQRCVATAKIAIHRSLEDAFIESFHQLSKKIIIDHPINHPIPPFMGPLIDEKAVDNFLKFMAMASREGAAEVMRGKKIEKGHNGHYVSPSIHRMKKNDPQSVYLSSEIFGPNCCFIPFDTLEEAVFIANQGPYGLAGSVFTQSETDFKYCLDEIQVGVLNCNRSTAGASARLPFGGVKASGNHRPAAVSMIDACAYPVASLKLINTATESWEVEAKKTPGILF